MVKKKIGIISIMEAYNWGGSEELWFDMAKVALNLKHDVCISYKQWNKIPEKISKIEELGAKLFYRKSEKVYPSLSTRLINKIASVNLQKKENSFSAIFDEKPDVLFINEGAFTSILHFKDLYSLLLNNNIPYVILSHQNREFGVIKPKKYSLAKEIYTNASKVLFVSERNKKMANILLCKTLKNSSVVKNPVNLKEITPLPFPSIDKIKLACVGRLFCAQKGQDLLLRALSKLKDTYDFELTFYGTGEDELYLKELTTYLDLEENVTFAGYEKNVRNIWKHNQMLILPSHYEGMPLVVVEAMLCGRVCLVTDVAGHSEWIEDGKNGFISVSNEINTLIRALKTAFEGKKDWNIIGAEANKKALNNYSISSGEELLKLLI